MFPAQCQAHSRCFINVRLFPSSVPIGCETSSTEREGRRKEEKGRKERGREGEGEGEEERIRRRRMRRGRGGGKRGSEGGD